MPSIFVRPIVCASDVPMPQPSDTPPRPPHQIPVEEPDDEDRDPTVDPTIRDPRPPSEDAPIRLPPGAEAGATNLSRGMTL